MLDALKAVCTEALGLSWKSFDGTNDNETTQEYLRNGPNSSLIRQYSDSPTKELTEFIIQPVLNEIIDEDGNVNDRELQKSVFQLIQGACSYYRIQAA